MSLDLEAQYEKIYHYCYYHLHHREWAEDITQETFLRWFASDTRRSSDEVLCYLYTIARNLCIDEYRRKKPEPFPENLPGEEDRALGELLSLRLALDKLSEADRELVLLRYVNEEPMGAIAKLYGTSRFALYRRLKRILSILKNSMKEE